MEELMRYLGDAHTPVAFATAYGDEPRVRFFSFKMVVDGEIYFITSKKKAVYKEIASNRNAEVCSMPGADGTWVRLRCKVEFVRDEALNKKAFEVLPMLEKAYGTWKNTDIVLLRLRDKKAMKFSLDGGRELLDV